MISRRLALERIVNFRLSQTGDRVWMVLGAAVGCQARAYERGQGEPATQGERGMISQVRHLNSTIHHAFGYEYVITKDRAFLTMGDEIFGASFATDTLRNLA